MTQPVALVTGAGQGIGRAIARQLATEGFQVVVNDLPGDGSDQSERAAQVVEEIRSAGGTAVAIAADVGDRLAVEGMVDQVVCQVGRLDVAVANAAWNIKKPVLDTAWSEIQRIMNVTLYGAFHVAQLAARQMQQQAFLPGRSSRGKLLFIGSIHAEMAIPFHVPYAVAKAGVNQLCRCFAAEMLTHRINVNAINPGWIDTPGERAYIAEEQLLEAAKDLPWGRLGTPHEIATLATFLLGNDSDYMTGEVISIDGGLRIDQRSLTHGLED